MAFARWEKDSTDAFGNLQENVLVEVRSEGTGALATCYSDRLGATQLTNPFTASSGQIGFHAAGGSYRIQLTAGGETRTLRYQGIGTYQESDIGVSSIAGYTFSFESGTSAPPSSYSIRANNADLSAATEIYVDDETQSADDISSIILLLAPVAGYATNRIVLTDLSDGQTATFDVTSVTDNTDYVTLTVSNHVGTTSIEVGSTKLNITMGGKSGANAGFRFQFDDGVSDADPGAGKFRFDSGTLGSITKIWINDADYDGLDVVSHITSFDDNLNSNARGYLRYQNQADVTEKVEFAITGAVVDKTGYYEIPVNYVSGALPSDDDIMIDGFSASGTDAVSSGLSFVFDTTTADADPGSGKLRLNNATISSATEAYIDNSDADGADVTSDLDSWDDSTNTTKGTLILRSKSTTTTYAKFTVSGSVVDGTGYRKLTIAHTSGNGSFSDTEQVTLNFSIAGNKGADGGGATVGKAIAMAIVFGG